MQWSTTQSSYTRVTQFQQSIDLKATSSGNKSPHDEILKPKQGLQADELPIDKQAKRLN